MSNTSSIQVHTDLTVLPTVLEWFNQNHPGKIPQIVWMQCQIILAEGLTNAIRHAHRDQSPELPISIEFTVEDQSLELRIWDQGPEFNLQQKLDTLPPLMESTQIGGRGLPLIQHIADQVTYQRSIDRRNCLVMVKHFQPVD